MEDTLISLETAILAKNKGFNIPVLHYWRKARKPYISKGLEYHSDAYTESNWNDGLGSYPTTADEVEASAPNQSLLQKWLREEHDLSVIIALSHQTKYQYYWDIRNSNGIIESMIILDLIDRRDKLTYEEALEEGLKKALELIK